MFNQLRIYIVFRASNLFYGLFKSRRTSHQTQMQMLPTQRSRRVRRGREKGKQEEKRRETFQVVCHSNIPRWPRGAKRSTVIARKGPVTDIPLSILPDTPLPGSCCDTNVYTATTCSGYRNRNLWNLRPEFPYEPATLSSTRSNFSVVGLTNLGKTTSTAIDISKSLESFLGY